MLGRLRKWMEDPGSPPADPGSLDIERLHELSLEFGRGLNQVKASAAPPDFPWYPFDSLTNWAHLRHLLTGERRKLLTLAGSAPVLDIGAADGEASFFLEWLGLEVIAVDNPCSHHNAMTGFWKLHHALHSKISAYTVDLDHDWRLPREDFGLALFLGVLYHLKNPFGAMERLAVHVKHCLLSTRIVPHQEPVARIVGPDDDCGADTTNYWLFSESGLRRLCERTGWTIADFAVFPTSDPNDLRAFCLLRSEVLPDWIALSGWHEREAHGWRWTGRVFSAELPRPGSASQCAELTFYLPPGHLEQLGPLTLRVRCAGRLLSERLYAQAGTHRLTAAAERWPETRMIRLDFELDKAAPPAGLDERELGIVVQSLGWRETRGDLPSGSEIVVDKESQ